MKFFLASCLASVATTLTPAWADTGDLTLNVVDRSGGIVPVSKSQITLTCGGGVIQPISAVESDGHYAYQPPAGLCRAAITFVGFAKEIVTGIQVTANESASRSITLSVGDTLTETETTDVSVDPPKVNIQVQSTQQTTQSPALTRDCTDQVKAIVALASGIDAPYLTKDPNVYAADLKAVTVSNLIVTGVSTDPVGFIEGTQSMDAQTNDMDMRPITGKISILSTRGGCIVKSLILDGSPSS